MLSRDTTDTLHIQTRLNFLRKLCNLNKFCYNDEVDHLQLYHLMVFLCQNGVEDVIKNIVGTILIDVIKLRKYITDIILVGSFTHDWTGIVNTLLNAGCIVDGDHFRRAFEER